MVEVYVYKIVGENSTRAVSTGTREVLDFANESLSFRSVVRFLDSVAHSCRHATAGRRTTTWHGGETMNDEKFIRTDIHL